MYAVDGWLVLIIMFALVAVLREADKMKDKIAKYKSFIAMEGLEQDFADYESFIEKAKKIWRGIHDV